MIQNLIILGFLKTRPASGYDIKKFIDKDLGIFSQLETSSIYYPLKKMEAEGLIEKEEVKDRKVRKYIYRITAKGEREFIRLSKKALVSQKRPFIDIDIPLYFLSFLNKKDILPLLRLQLIFLNRVQRWLINKRSDFKKYPKNIHLILKHHLDLAITEREFIKEMIGVIKENKH